MRSHQTIVSTTTIDLNITMMKAFNVLVLVVFLYKTTRTRTKKHFTIVMFKSIVVVLTIVWRERVSLILFYLIGFK